MRFPLILFLICLYPAAGWSQNQERKLIDRLLRPNMELQNDAQGKKFATNSQATARSSMAGTFFVAPTQAERQVTDIRTIAPQECSSRSFQSDSHGSSLLQNRAAKLAGRLTTPPARGVRETHDAHLEVPSRNFPGGELKFRERGKSQKSLDRENPPLTIDQVRELLNKNK